MIAYRAIAYTKGLNERGKLVRKDGFEPSSAPRKGESSTAEVHARVL